MRKQITTIFFFALAFLFPKTVLAQGGPQPWTSRCYKTITNADIASLGTNTIDVATIQGFECIFANILRILIPLLGLAMLIVFITSAFTYITAGSDVKHAQKARQGFTYAFAGLFAFFIVYFLMRLLEQITGFRLTLLQIPGP